MIVGLSGCCPVISEQVYGRGISAINLGGTTEHYAFALMGRGFFYLTLGCAGHRKVKIENKNSTIRRETVCCDKRTAKDV